MRIKFNDGTMRDVDPMKAAELIFMSQRRDGDVPFTIEAPEGATQDEYDSMLSQVEHYLNQLRVKHRFYGY